MATRSRRVVFGGASTLDNCFARPDHAVDWIQWSDELSAVMKDYWASFDTILMGRKTYDVAVARGMGDASPGMATYVFSRTLSQAGRGVSLVPGDPVEFVAALKRESGKDICLMGGGELARSMLEAGLVDEIGLNIHPVLLGAGIPVFHPMAKQIDLELKECRPFKNGCVLVTYSVKR